MIPLPKSRNIGLYGTVCPRRCISAVLVVSNFFRVCVLNRIGGAEPRNTAQKHRLEGCRPLNRSPLTLRVRNVRFKALQSCVASNLVYEILVCVSSVSLLLYLKISYPIFRRFFSLHADFQKKCKIGNKKSAFPRASILSVMSSKNSQFVSNCPDFFRFVQYTFHTTRP